MCLCFDPATWWRFLGPLGCYSMLEGCDMTARGGRQGVTAWGKAVTWWLWGSLWCYNHIWCPKVAIWDKMGTQIVLLECWRLPKQFLLVQNVDWAVPEMHRITPEAPQSTQSAFEDRAKFLYTKFIENVTLSHSPDFLGVWLNKFMSL